MERASLFLALADKLELFRCSGREVPGMGHSGTGAMYNEDNCIHTSAKSNVFDVSPRQVQV